MIAVFPSCLNYLSYPFVYIFYIYYEIVLLFDCNLLLYIICKFSYFCISDIVIYLVYIDLMRKRCKLINVDVDVDA